MGKVKTTILTRGDDVAVRKPAPVTTFVTKAEYLDALETIEAYVKDLRPLRHNQKNLDQALSIVKIFKFNGMLSYKFRNETYKQLEELIDDLYLEVNGFSEDE